MRLGYSLDSSSQKLGKTERPLVPGKKRSEVSAINISAKRLYSQRGS